MTTEARKSLVAAAGVLVCIAALGGGAIMRDRVELGPRTAEKMDISGLVASNSDSTVVPETKFFQDMMELLKRKYVEPISDDRKLADGAVRGMVANLSDGNSLFMDPDQYRVYHAANEGRYEGIGAHLVLDTGGFGQAVKTSGDPEEVLDGDGKLPRLVIAAVAPGGAAEKAGLKPGDWAEFVDDHWLPNSEALEKFVKLQRLVLDDKATPEQSAQYQNARRELRAKMEKSMLPIKARDLLMMGETGTVKVVWARGEQRIPTTLSRGVATLPAVSLQADGSIKLAFIPGAPEKLREAIGDKKDVVIDLRGAVGGDYEVMTTCLAELGKSGNYGYFVTRRKEAPTSFTIKDGTNNPPRVTVLVDSQTRGLSEIFALALKAHGGATLKGDRTAGERLLIRWYQLPSKAGYTLVTGEYRASNPGPVAQKTSSTKDVVR